MKKGSSARHCRCCGKIVAWAIPTGETILGIRMMEMRFLPDCALPFTGKGYICKACKEKEKASK